MDETNYKFDVAFSFVADDEALAVELNDLLQDRLKTFLYSRQQEKLAGTDGEKTFSDVFGGEARIVVVLFRKLWGQTRWTRIEETAIRGRAFEEGYDFTLFIPLDDNRDLPKWLPKTQIWFDLGRWGPAGAAAVIEQKAREQGGAPREEGVDDRAARLTRAIDYRNRRQAFLASYEGANAATVEARALSDEIEALTTLDSIRTIGVHHKRDNICTVLLLQSLGLSVAWQSRYTNTLQHSQLAIILWKGHPPFRGVMHWDKPQQLDGQNFLFDLSSAGHTYWVNTAGRRFSTKELAGHIVKYYLDQINKRLLLKPEDGID